jgi:hypothetical protein
VKKIRHAAFISGCGFDIDQLTSKRSDIHGRKDTLTMYVWASRPG